MADTQAGWFWVQTIQVIAWSPFSSGRWNIFCLNNEYFIFIFGSRCSSAINNNAIYCCFTYTKLLYVNTGREFLEVLIALSCLGPPEDQDGHLTWKSSCTSCSLCLLWSLPWHCNLRVHSEVPYSCQYSKTAGTEKGDFILDVIFWYCLNFFFLLSGFSITSWYLQNIFLEWIVFIIAYWFLLLRN